MTSKIQSNRREIERRMANETEMVKELKFQALHHAKMYFTSFGPNINFDVPDIVGQCLELING